MKSYVIKNIIGVVLFIYFAFWFCFGGGFEYMRSRKIRRRMHWRNRKHPSLKRPVEELKEAEAKRERGYRWPANIDGYGWAWFDLGRIKPDQVGGRISLETSNIGYWKMANMSPMDRKNLKERIKAIKHDDTLESVFTDEELDCVYNKYLTLTGAYPPSGDGRRKPNEIVRESVNLRQTLHVLFSDMEKRRNPPPVEDDNKKLDKLLAKRQPGYPWPCGDATVSEIERGGESFRIGQLRGSISGAEQVECFVSSLELFPMDRPLELIYTNEAIDILYSVWRKLEASLFMKHTETNDEKKRRVMLRRFFESMEERKAKDWS